MNNKKLLIANTAILSISGFILRSIGVSFNIHLTSYIGAAGIGLFQLIINVYALFVTAGCAGIKLAATRLITLNHSGNGVSEKRIVRKCIAYCIICGTTAAVILFLFSGLIAEKWIADRSAAVCLKILSLSLPFVSVSACFAGIFTGRKTLLRYCGIQLIQELFKIVTTLFLLSSNTQSTVSVKCCCVCISITLAEILSVFLCFIFYCNSTAKSTDNSNTFPIKDLLRISIPDVTGSTMRSILLTVEHLLIPIGFKKSGHSTAQALTVYGTVHAMALPVILYPAVILTGLSNMLVPELSESLSSGSHKRINSISNISLKLTFMFASATAGFLFCFSDQVSFSVYNEGSTAQYIQLLSLLLPVMYLDTVTDGLLKGLDQQVYSMKYNIFDSGLCVLLVWLLLPKYEIKGYIFILFFSEIINFSLSIHRLSKVTVIKFNVLKDIILPLLISAGSAVTVKALYVPITTVTSYKAGCIALIVIYCLIYLGIYSLFKLIKQIAENQQSRKNYA